MTSTGKQKIADFLDLTQDYYTYGYKGEKREYHFEDDAPAAQSDTGNIDTSGIGSTVITDKTDSLEKIAAEIRACYNCQLGKTRTNAAPGEGVSRPLVMVIGEGPGADEDAQGRPFVGKAGQLLDKMLASINLSRNTNCFIANVVKCRPPNNRDPYPEETIACARFLERQITLLKPKFILVVGRIAMQTLLKTTEPIKKNHGKITELTVGDSTYPLLITYHPALLLRYEEYKRPAWEDLKLLRSKLDELKGGE
jgi:uracil-DNA glycosylase